MKKYQYALAYLGTRPVREIAEQYGVSPACVNSAARRLCIQFANALPLGHPLKSKVARGETIRREEWRRYKDEIQGFVQGLRGENCYTEALSSAEQFWRKLDTRAKNAIKNTLYYVPEFEPSDAARFEKEVIAPLVRLTDASLLRTQNVGRKTMEEIDAALESAAYPARKHL
jgi:hypothetical protein